MKNRLFYTIWRLLLVLADIMIIFFLLINHINDGNIFGVYIQNNTLCIGDFWLDILLIVFIRELVIDIKKVGVKE